MDIVVSAVAKGHDVTVFTGSDIQPSKGMFSIIKVIPYNRKNPYRRVVTWGLFSLKLLEHLLFRRRAYDIILVSSNPPFAPNISLFARRPFLLLLYDLYPHVLNRYSSSLLIAGVRASWAALNKRLYREASGIITLSSQMAVEIAGKGRDADLVLRKTIIIPPWYDGAIFAHLDNTKKNCGSGIEMDGRFVVLYSGNMGVTHPLEDLVDAALLLKEEPGIRFFLVGAGARRKELEVRSASAPNIVFRDPYPIADMASLFSAASIGIVALDSESSASSVPSKTFNLLAAGKPIIVIGTSDSELARIIIQEKAGYVVSPGNPSELARLVSRLFQSKEEIDFLSRNSAKAANAYSPSNAKKIIDFIETCLEENTLPFRGRVKSRRIV
jgi:colanic acid biosynthesis glycosyl transferase WcaI